MVSAHSLARRDDNFKSGSEEGIIDRWPEKEYVVRGSFKEASMSNQEKEEARKRLEGTINNCAVFSLGSLAATVFGASAVAFDMIMGWNSLKPALIAVMVGYPAFLLICFSLGYFINKNELNALDRTDPSEISDQM
jgi:hypothetical protein